MTTDNSQVNDDELGIGTATRLMTIEAEEDGSLQVEAQFFANVRLFYETTVKTIVTKSPFQDQKLTDLQVLNPATRLSVSIASVIRLATRFADMSPEDLDMVLSQLRDYKTAPSDQLPSFSGDLDNLWHQMGRLLMPGDISQLRFGKLFELVKVLLVLPHGNADPERLFSIVGKIETEQRGRLLPSTVHDLISVKINALSGSPCYEAGETF